jgi:hypothetical protein
MSKVKQIENALKAIDPAAFQSLCDLYLRRRGYENANSIGLVLGANKVTQGTPDTLFLQPDGTYVFAEYSTQQDRLLEKFERDLDNCFDSSKTGIPVAKIREVVLCHNSKLSPEELHALREKGHLDGVPVSIIGPFEIAYDLYDKYPGLAREFLNIEVDTGQIIPIEEFVKAYNKGAFATPIDTTFYFRDDELNKAIKALESDSLVIIGGRAGVGKTRFTIESCRRYAAKHPEVIVRCIFNKGPDIFQDLHVHFSAPGQYLILVDDANRVNRFEYALQLLNEQTADKTFKIVATVRDYMLRRLLESTKLFGDAALIELQPFNDEEIKGIVQGDDFGIINHYYLERIVEIAKGNPRLAIMAACVAKRENNLRSIDDVSVLYDEYFSSIRHDLNDFGDTTLIKVAGIIAFFRVIDRSNDEFMQVIRDAFDIDADLFWRAARRLHDFEMVDIYGEEVVRISDQVLSTYLFYLAVFRERALDFKALLERFFPKFRYRLIDALNPVLSAFGGDRIAEQLRPHVAHAWRTLRQQGDEESLLHLMDVFWFVNPTDTLIYARDSIQALKQEPCPVNELKFIPDTQVPPTPSILGVLDNFQHADGYSFRVSLILLLEYLEKRPAELSLVIRMLTERYGINHRSYLNKFVAERGTIESIWERTRDGEDELFSRLFLTIAEPILHTHFRSHEAKGSHAITIISFDLRATPELIELRRVIWGFVFALYSTPSLGIPVLEFFQKHTNARFRLEDQEIIASEAEYVQKFLGAALSPSEYRHCVIVQDYLALLERIGVQVDKDLKTSFNNETYKVHKLLFDDIIEQHKLGWEVYQQLRSQRLIAYTEGFDSADFDAFFDRCLEILLASDPIHRNFRFQFDISSILINLAERDPSLYEDVLSHYLQGGNKLHLNPQPLAAKLLEVFGPDRAYEILSSQEYPGKTFWLFGYFRVLPLQAVTTERLQHLYSLYGIATPQEVPIDLDYLLKFTQVDKEVIANVVRMLLTKAKSDPYIQRVLCTAFDENSQVCNTLRDSFVGDVNLLKHAYLEACEISSDPDSSGQVFNTLLDLDPNFAGDWVAWSFRKEGGPKFGNDSRDYSFLWQRDDHKGIIRHIIDSALTVEQSWYMISSHLKDIFMVHNDNVDAEKIRNRQGGFVDDLIEDKHVDRALMKVLFGLVSYLPASRRRNHIAEFMHHDQDFEAFDALPLEPGLLTWEGSAVPVYQKLIGFFESLLPLMNTIRLLDHKQKIELRVQELRDRTEWEKKRDFMRD